MWRITFGKKLSSFTSSLATGAAVLLSVAAAKAQIQVNIIEPALNAAASGSLSVRATVASVFEVSSVTAQVEGQQTNLKYSQPLNAWTNSVPLTGLAFGPHTLVVTAQEFFGGTAQAMRSFRVDNPPTLTVHEPINGTVVSGQVYVSAEATDDGGNTVITVSFQGLPRIIATNKVQGFFPVVASAGEYHVVIEANDAVRDRRLITSCKVVSEPSSNLTQTIVAPGTLFDFDHERLLYGFQKSIIGPNVIPAFGRPEPRILDRQSGREISSRTLLGEFIDGPIDASLHPVFISSGELVPKGALLWTSSILAQQATPLLLGWAETNASYLFQKLSPFSLNPKVVGSTTLGYRSTPTNWLLILQDVIEVDRSLQIPIQTVFTADLGPNQDLVYSSSNAVFRSRPANPDDPYANRVTTTLAQGGGMDNRDGVVTDGINVAYLGRVPNPFGIKTQLITLGGEETLAVWPSYVGAACMLSSGWAGYTKPGTSGQTQIWTRSPAGTQQQRTFFNASSTLESVGPNGEVTFLNNNARYVSLPGVQQPVWVNSGQGRVRWDDGKLLVILGRSVLEFRMGQLQCAALADGSSRLTFTGPNGLSYTVQGSADLKNWNDLWTFAHTTGSISWTNPPASAHHFYRAVTATSP